MIIATAEKERDIVCQNCLETVAKFVKVDADEEILDGIALLSDPKESNSFFQEMSVDTCLNTYQCKKCGCTVQVIW